MISTIKNAILEYLDYYPVTQLKGPKGTVTQLKGPKGNRYSAKGTKEKWRLS